MHVALPNHSVVWWATKLLCGLGLITGLVLRFVANVEPQWHSQIIVGQVLVVVFGAVSLGHYWLLKRANADIGKPIRLVSHGGLFNLIRHPMYFADIFIYLGLFLLFMHPLSLLILLLGLIAVFKQAVIEDSALAKQFGQKYWQWQGRSKLLVPYVI